MFTSVIKFGDGNPLSMYLPSAGDIVGNPDTIFTASVLARDTCDFTTWLCVHNRTVVMYNRYFVKKDCVIENSRKDEKALIFSVITNGTACEVIGGEQVEHGVGAVNMGIMSKENVHIQQLVGGCNFEKISVMMSESDFKIYNERFPIIFSRFEKHFASNKPFVGVVHDTSGKILEAARDLQNAVLSKSINPYYVEGLIVECLVNYYYEVFHQPLPDNYTVCRKIFKARDILNESYKNPPTLRELAANVGTNECTLKKVFKQMFSMTVFDYLNDLRMNKAARLLSENSLTISEIANELGFSSQSHFCTAFRKRHGLTPKEFREGKAERMLKILMCFLIALLAACARPSENQTLFDRVYALINDGEYKMAREYFDNHKSEIQKPMSQSDSMYRNFLDGYLEMLDVEDDVSQIDKFVDTSKVERLIDYYNKTSDNEKLAYSLLLKSQKLYLMSRHNDGVRFLKQAENIVNQLDNIELKYNLAAVKLSYNTNNLDLRTAMPLLDSMSKYAHNQRQRIDINIAKAFFYAVDNNPDSAKTYILRCPADTTDYTYMSKYAWIFADDEPEKCERYACKVLADKPKSMDADYARLGIIKSYCRRGLTAEAEDFCTNDPIMVSFPAMLCYEVFYNHYKRTGDYEKAVKSAEVVIYFKNLLIDWAHNYKVSQNSEKYDFQVELLENQNRFQRWVIAFVVLAAAMAFIVVVQRRRYERKLSVNRQILKESRDKIDELKTLENSDETDKEISRLQRKIAEIETRYAEIYHDGKILYEQIFEQDGNSSQWNKKDYEKFLEYYKTVDLSLLTQIEDEYNGINPRQTFFKILTAKGLDKPSIMRKMGIMEDVTFRALKSKVEGMRRK